MYKSRKRAARRSIPIRRNHTRKVSPQTVGQTLRHFGYGPRNVFSVKRLPMVRRQPSIRNRQAAAQLEENELHSIAAAEIEEAEREELHAIAREERAEMRREARYQALLAYVETILEAEPTEEVAALFENLRLERPADARMDQLEERMRRL